STGSIVTRVSAWVAERNVSDTTHKRNLKRPISPFLLTIGGVILDFLENWSFFQHRRWRTLSSSYWLLFAVSRCARQNRAKKAAFRANKATGFLGVFEQCSAIRIFKGFLSVFFVACQA